MDSIGARVCRCNQGGFWFNLVVCFYSCRLGNVQLKTYIVQATKQMIVGYPTIGKWLSHLSLMRLNFEHGSGIQLICNFSWFRKKTAAGDILDAQRWCHCGFDHHSGKGQQKGTPKTSQNVWITFPKTRQLSQASWLGRTVTSCNKRPGFF